MTPEELEALIASRAQLWERLEFDYAELNQLRRTDPSAVEMLQAKRLAEELAQLLPLLAAHDAPSPMLAATSLTQRPRQSLRGSPNASTSKRLA